MTKDYALVIGIEDYKVERLNKLTGPINDANDFYNWVTSPNQGNAQAILLTSNNGFTELLLSQIEDKLEQLIELAKEENNARRFYFYFSGHGLGVSLEEVALLLTDWTERMANRGISSKKWHDSIKDFGIFKQTLFFLDCCRERKVNVKPQGSPLWTPGTHPNAAATESFTAYASSHWQVAYEDDMPSNNNTRRNGYFTKALVEGLQGKAADASGVVTLAQLKSYLFNETTRLAAQKNRTQKVRFEDSFTDSNTIINTVSISNPPQTNVKITFSVNTVGPYQILDKNLNQVGTWEKINGNWLINLPLGLNLLIDTSTQQNLSIIVTPNNIQNVQF